MNKINTLIFLAVILTANTIFAYLKFVKGDDLFYKEHQLVENLQAFLLILSCIVFLIYSFLLEKCSSLLVLSFSLLSLTFFLREVNLGDFNIPALLIQIGGSDMGRDLTLSILWTLMAFFIALEFRNIKKLVLVFFLSKSAILMLISAGLLIASDVFERWFDQAVNSEFFEELLEFNAYYFLFLSSLVSRASLKNIKESPQQSNPKLLP